MDRCHGLERAAGATPKQVAVVSEPLDISISMTSDTSDGGRRPLSWSVSQTAGTAKASNQTGSAHACTWPVTTITPVVRTCSHAPRLEAVRQANDGPFGWLDPAEPGLSGATTVLDSSCFKYMMYLVILANIFQLGASVQITGHEWDTVWQICDHFFTFAFAFEMILKVSILRKAYFMGRWNIMDFALVWLGVADSWILPVVCTSGDSVHLNTLKLFRLLRLARIVKLMRMRRELRVLLEGMLDSVRSMFWVGLLLALIIYTFAIFCIMVVGDSLERPAGHNYFGDIPRAMLSLFNIAVLTDWSIIVWAVFDTHPGVVPVLILFVVITSWGVLNVIIGLIVERTNAASQKVGEEDREHHRKMQLEAVDDLTKMMCELDTNNDEWLSLEEMAAAPMSGKFADLLKQINLPPGFRLQDLYLMLDQDANQQVTRKEFVDGMYRIVHGNEFQRTCLNHLALAQVKRQVRQAHKEMKHELQRVRQEQRELAKEMRDGLNQVLREVASLRQTSFV